MAPKDKEEPPNAAKTPKDPENQESKVAESRSQESAPASASNALAPLIDALSPSPVTGSPAVAPTSQHTTNISTAAPSTRPAITMSALHNLAMHNGESVVLANSNNTGPREEQTAQEAQYFIFEGANLYALGGVQPNADFKAIKKGYNKKWHYYAPSSRGGKQKRSSDKESVRNRVEEAYGYWNAGQRILLHRAKKEFNHLREPYDAGLLQAQTAQQAQPAVTIHGSQATNGPTAVEAAFDGRMALNKGWHGRSGKPLSLSLWDIDAHQIQNWCQVLTPLRPDNEPQPKAAPAPTRTAARSSMKPFEESSSSEESESDNERVAQGGEAGGDKNEEEEDETEADKGEEEAAEVDNNAEGAEEGDDPEDGDYVDDNTGDEDESEEDQAVGDYGED